MRHSLGIVKAWSFKLLHERMGPDVFEKGLNVMRLPDRCRSMQFSSSFYLECEVVCHPKCAPLLPATCGIPTEYVRHFADTMSRAKAVSTMKLSVADLRLEMKGWMKAPKYVIL